jgi:hypothetical protein
MAMVAAWWGVWHMLAGAGAARFFTLQDSRAVAALGGQEA